MYIIFNFSGQTGDVSSQLSLKVSAKIVEAGDYVFNANLEQWQIDEWANKINFITRKLAHMTIYFALAIAVSFPLYVYGLHGIGLMLVAGIICVGFAAGDEYHQSFVAGRGPSWRDVGIDSVGVFFGIILVRMVGWTGRMTIFRPKKKKIKKVKRIKKVKAPKRQRNQYEYYDETEEVWDDRESYYEAGPKKAHFNGSNGGTRGYQNQTQYQQPNQPYYDPSYQNSERQWQNHETSYSNEYNGRSNEVPPYYNNGYNPHKTFHQNQNHPYSQSDFNYENQYDENDYYDSDFDPDEESYYEEPAQQSARTMNHANPQYYYKSSEESFNEPEYYDRHEQYGNPSSNDVPDYDDYEETDEPSLFEKIKEKTSWFR